MSDYADDFRADELDAVMHSVDKWFDAGDPRLKQNPATRAADAREIALRAIEEEARRVKPLVEALEQSRMAHYVCDDCWFSCPKSREGCCNDDSGDECTCGADSHNARIDAALAAYRGNKP